MAGLPTSKPSEGAVTVPRQPLIWLGTVPWFPSEFPSTQCLRRLVSGCFPHVGVSINGGTPSYHPLSSIYHPFIDGFSLTKTIHFWGTPMAMESPMCFIPRHVGHFGSFNFFCEPRCCASGNATIHRRNMKCWPSAVRAVRPCGESKRRSNHPKTSKNRGTVLPKIFNRSSYTVLMLNLISQIYLCWGNTRGSIHLRRHTHQGNDEPFGVQRGSKVPPVFFGRFLRPGLGSSQTTTWKYPLVIQRLGVAVEYQRLSLTVATKKSHLTVGTVWLHVPLVFMGYLYHKISKMPSYH